MKKLFILFWTMLAISASGQTSVYHPLPDSNASWNCSFFQPMCQFGYAYENYSILISGDTIINSQVYHKLTTPFVEFYTTGTCTQGLIPMYKGAIRQEIANKKVFYISPGYTTEELLYDFNMNIGDTVKGFLYSIGVGYDTVISIDSVLVGNNFHKRWKINSEYLIYLIEGVGSTYGLIEHSPGHITDANTYSIACLQQNGSTIYPDSTSNCQLITAINEIGKPSNRVKVFPNPSNSSFTVDFDNLNNVREIRIVNLLGKIVFQQSINNQSKIVIDNLPSGVYILTLIDNENRKTNQKIISSP